ncbi:hypothetical protein DIPPA_33784 [Diplonema papillatum]|nr:hypothetical protein DIPPA_33784 [Diplonema papillatum]
MSVSQDALIPALHPPFSSYVSNRLLVLDGSAEELLSLGGEGKEREELLMMMLVREGSLVEKLQGRLAQRDEELGSVEGRLVDAQAQLSQAMRRFAQDKAMFAVEFIAALQKQIAEVTPHVDLVRRHINETKPPVFEEMCGKPADICYRCTRELHHDSRRSSKYGEDGHVPESNEKLWTRETLLLKLLACSKAQCRDAEASALEARHRLSEAEVHIRLLHNWMTKDRTAGGPGPRPADANLQLMLVTCNGLKYALHRVLDVVKGCQLATADMSRELEAGVAAAAQRHAEFKRVVAKAFAGLNEFFGKLVSSANRHRAKARPGRQGKSTSQLLAAALNAWGSREKKADAGSLAVPFAFAASCPNPEPRAPDHPLRAWEEGGYASVLDRLATWADTSLEGDRPLLTAAAPATPACLGPRQRRLDLLNPRAARSPKAAAASSRKKSSAKQTPHAVADACTETEPCSSAARSDDPESDPEDSSSGGGKDTTIAVTRGKSTSQLLAAALNAWGSREKKADAGSLAVPFAFAASCPNPEPRAPDHPLRAWEEGGYASVLDRLATWADTSLEGDRPLLTAAAPATPAHRASARDNGESAFSTPVVPARSPKAAAASSRKKSSAKQPPHAVADACTETEPCSPAASKGDDPESDPEDSSSGRGKDTTCETSTNTPQRRDACSQTPSEFEQPHEPGAAAANYFPVVHAAACQTDAARAAVATETADLVESRDAAAGPGKADTSTQAEPPVELFDEVTATGFSFLLDCSRELATGLSSEAGVDSVYSKAYTCRYVMEVPPDVLSASPDVQLSLATARMRFHLRHADGLRDEVKELRRCVGGRWKKQVEPQVVDLYSSGLPKVAAAANARTDGVRGGTPGGGMGRRGHTAVAPLPGPGYKLPQFCAKESCERTPQWPCQPPRSAPAASCEAGACLRPSAPVVQSGKVMPRRGSISSAFFVPKRPHRKPPDLAGT